VILKSETYNFARKLCMSDSGTQATTATTTTAPFLDAGDP
jgi:hypothetical protein